MQADYAARFTREMGCTDAELRSWIPGASRTVDIQWRAQGASLDLGSGGRLEMAWQTLPPRRIALISLPRLSVTFDFGELPADQRHAFMRHFDLYTQRGGG